MAGDLAAYASGARASVLLLANTSGLSEHLPKTLAAFLREHPDINVDIEERESSDIIGLTNATALQIHIARQAARLGARLRFRARLRDFDAICQMVAADVGIAVVPEGAAKRCARSMPIMMLTI